MEAQANKEKYWTTIKTMSRADSKVANKQWIWKAHHASVEASSCREQEYVHIYVHRWSSEKRKNEITMLKYKLFINQKNIKMKSD